MIRKNYSRRTVTVAMAVMTVILTAFAIYGQSQNYTGDGGKGMSLTIYVPQSTGLAKEQSYIPALVQGGFVSSFSNYSAISILDWERLDDIYVKLIAEEYDDKAAAKMDVALGHLAPTSHFLTGSIIKTATGYNIKINITATANKMTAASYSGTFSFTDLDNLTGVRRASLELLLKAGVKLTDKAKQELAGSVEANEVSAQTALAKGVTAQRAGTEVAALSYYYQAANFNPSLKEAVKRSSVVAANISSGNIGADVRNDIAWRKRWIALLTETEEVFYNAINAADPPYTLTYFTNIRTGNIDYQRETADLSVAMSLRANKAWFDAAGPSLGAAAQAALAVLDGLNATKKKTEWGLGLWPRTGVSKTNPFVSDSRVRYDIAVDFELVNQEGRVIGKKSVTLNPAFNLKRDDNGRFNVDIAGGDIIGAIKFGGVKADDISDNLTIRVASVNGAPPQKARFTIAAKPFAEKLKPFTDARNGKKYNTVKIGGMVWMAENLNYQPQTGNSWCYKDSASYCDKYGRLYDWNTAKQVCPKGWHLPDTWEWKSLVVLVDVAGGGKAGTMLKAKSGWEKLSDETNGNGTDDYGFSAMPGGCRNNRDKSYAQNSSYGHWWTSTEFHCVRGIGVKSKECSYPYASSWQINYSDDLNNNVGEKDDDYKEYGYSVRCVQD
ncbi:hypothetical protein R80B4_02386 [Fibrobacteres bacterium R8-0-B4]